MKQSQKKSSSTISNTPIQQLSSMNNLPSIQEKSLPFWGWMLLPLRLFLGATFVYAGVQKLTDPQFFHKTTPGYIGNQIISFAHGSLLQHLLVKSVLPHAVFFGWIIILGEIAIGLGTLLGGLFRPAAFFGMLLSLLFFLTASWHVYPYFYGADIVFAVCWLTLLLSGPAATGMPSVDGWLLQKLFPYGTNQQQRPEVRWLCILLLGATPTHSARTMPQIFQKGKSHNQRVTLAQQKLQTRRIFLSGILLGGAGAFGLTLLGYALHVFGQPSNNNNTATGSANPSSLPSQSSTTQSGTSSTLSQTTVAKVSAVPKNSSMTFTIPATGDPGILIHLSNDQFVAYDATCTHAGCQVGYDPTSHALVCPCHGAAFDPANQAAVLQGPAATPLAVVSLHIDSATGAITLS